MKFFIPNLLSIPSFWSKFTEERNSIFWNHPTDIHIPVQRCLKTLYIGTKWNAVQIHIKHWVKTEAIFNQKWRMGVGEMRDSQTGKLRDNDDLTFSLVTGPSLERRHEEKQRVDYGEWCDFSFKQELILSIAHALFIANVFWHICVQAKAISFLPLCQRAVFLLGSPQGW